jgi:hypothetical protein
MTQHLIENLEKEDTDPMDAAGDNVRPFSPLPGDD